MSKTTQRLIIGLPILIFCFGLIALDAWGKIDISKMGYTALGAWIALIINFYFRKSGETNGK